LLRLFAACLPLYRLGAWFRPSASIIPFFPLRLVRWRHYSNAEPNNRKK
jgi:hypothetical protein